MRRLLHVRKDDCSSRRSPPGEPGTGAPSSTCCRASTAAGRTREEVGRAGGRRRLADVAQRQLDTERDELDTFAEEEREDLRLIHRAKRLPDEAATAAADRLTHDQRVTLRVRGPRAAGTGPDKLESSPLVAAVSSFHLFAVGTIVPTANRRVHGRRRCSRHRDRGQRNRSARPQRWPTLTNDARPGATPYQSDEERHRPLFQLRVSRDVSPAQARGLVINHGVQCQGQHGLGPATRRVAP